MKIKNGKEVSFHLLKHTKNEEQQSHSKSENTQLIDENKDNSEENSVELIDIKQPTKKQLIPIKRVTRNDTRLSTKKHQQDFSDYNEKSDEYEFSQDINNDDFNDDDVNKLLEDQNNQTPYSIYEEAEYDEKFPQSNEDVVKKTLNLFVGNFFDRKMKYLRNKIRVETYNCVYLPTVFFITNNQARQGSSKHNNGIRCNIKNDEEMLLFEIIKAKTADKLQQAIDAYIEYTEIKQ